MKIRRLSILMVFLWTLALLPVFPAMGDGVYFTTAKAPVAVSTDQQAIIIKNGEEISMTFSTGYTGEGDDFAWIIPTPVAPAMKDVTESGEIGRKAFDALERETAPREISHSYGGGGGCFPAGTKVLTKDGPVPISAVEAGVRVYSYDLEHDAWVLGTVVRRLSHQYDGDMITIRLGNAVVEATGNHPFCVLQGNALGSRSPASDVPAAERETNRAGRWVDARGLEAGDVVVTKSGGSSTITAIASRNENTVVYNLKVKRFSTYAVGRLGLLVHNKGSGEKSATTSSEQTTVTVYGHVVLEHYAINVLGSSDELALVRWLRGNGYRVDPSASVVLKDYVDRRWSFVAVKLNPREKRHYENELLPPLTMKYRYDRLVFPLRISSVSSADTVKLRLYVVAGSSVSSSNFTTRQLRFSRFFRKGMRPGDYLETRLVQTIGRGGRGLVILWSGQLGTTASLLEGLTTGPFSDVGTVYLTRLEARIAPAQMVEDIDLRLDAVPTTFAVEIEAKESWPEPHEVGGLSGCMAIAACEDRSVALRNDGTVWGWGNNDDGQLGDGTTEDRPTPVQAQSITEVMAIAAGYGHTVALKRNGTVWAWGNNYDGQLGDGTRVYRRTPVQVQGITEVIAIAAGYRYTVALKRDGTVWAWGNNNNGQLGDGTTTGRPTPVRVRGLTEVIAIAAGGANTVALRKDGNVWAWGVNTRAQLGDGTTTDRRTPVQVGGTSGVTAIAASYDHVLALKADGTVWASGSNYFGQLGDRMRLNHSALVGAFGIRDVVKIAAGDGFAVALKNDGTVWEWGRNYFGQLGNGINTGSSTPAQVQGISDVTAIAAGYDHTVALKSDGTVWAWGRDNVGQPGSGSP